MTVQIWQSYSCNNSSSYRLVARFATAADARAASAELDTLLAAHAREIDARDGYRREPSAVQRDLAAKYGFTWSEVISWGDECRSCDGGLDYLDPRLHDIAAPQLVCRPCSGFYDVAALV